MIPALFIAHGAPLLAIEDNNYTQFLSQLGEKLPRPRAVILFSAHWVAGKQRVSEVKEYDTIYDFGGFPDALYQIKYPAKGNHQIAQQIENFLTENGIPFEVETERGLDHGAWVVLRLLYPNVDIPVIAMSVNPRLSPEQQYKIGQSMEKMRADDVLIIASGGTVHNLRALEWQEKQINDWALEFDRWLEIHINQWNLDSLYQYNALAPNASLAVPPYGNEHFIPLFYAMGAADNQRAAKLLHRSYRYGSLSHSVWQFGQFN
ncbi:dioxygenase [Fodinisporobacter ferrooxydans]|uniref:Dioxygenase n=1 Tax=Fodinisporobacter ferrooxydans TaxID=2901836 RepID=A0ABY4CGY3_9BACL|nr:dioxygenase [Alicyclobacillaceae bacterium MYW30-H2]